MVSLGSEAPPQAADPAVSFPRYHPGGRAPVRAGSGVGKGLKSGGWEVEGNRRSGIREGTDTTQGRDAGHGGVSPALVSGQ